MTKHGQIFQNMSDTSSYNMIAMKNAINKQFGEQAAKIRGGGAYMTIIMDDSEIPQIMQIIKGFGGSINID